MTAKLTMKTRVWKARAMEISIVQPLGICSLRLTMQCSAQFSRISIRVRCIQRKGQQIAGL
uniref:Uncharacterized protein n=1 Tax=Aegilops tauschii subsp. strangulata TaxID=200361 RepID=A0A452Z1H7_AEGTS